MIFSILIFDKNLQKQAVELRMSHVTSYMLLHEVRTSSRVLTGSIWSLAAFSPTQEIHIVYRLFKEVEEDCGVSCWEMDGKGTMSEYDSKELTNSNLQTQSLLNPDADIYNTFFSVRA